MTVLDLARSCTCVYVSFALATWTRACAMALFLLNTFRITMTTLFHNKKNELVVGYIVRC
jgi:hypothetical protein